jgi:thiol-disulfide isomerase/thioredoxin
MTNQSRSSRYFVVTALLMSVFVALVAACGGDTVVAPTPPTPVPAVGPLGVIPADTSTDTDPVVADEPVEEGPGLGEVGAVSQEIQTVAGWINTEPFTLESLRGKVVLIDFWTYTCVNCIRTFPYLREWHEKYGDEGLVVVGVHSPEFEFEHVRENVEAAVEKFGITWPVLQDNNFETWRAFANHFWPAKYLIDKNGVIQYRHFGEGSYDETEVEIRKWLVDAGSPIEGITANPDPGPTRHEQAGTGEFSTRQTRELFAGMNFNFNSQVPFIIQTEFYGSPPNTPILLEDTQEHLNNFLYLQGMWYNGPDGARHARVTDDLKDYVGFKYFSTSVNAVLGGGGEAYKVYVTVDDAAIPLGDRGADIEEDEEGATFITVDMDRMYGVIDSPEYGGHEMKLSSNSDQFTVFAFTFGAYGVGP